MLPMQQREEEKIIPVQVLEAICGLVRYGVCVSEVCPARPLSVKRDDVMHQPDQPVTNCRIGG
jgi:hypothetical protein